MSKAKNEVRGSYVTQKVINLVDIEATIPLPARESPQAPLSGFSQAYKKAKMVFSWLGGYVVGSFTLPNPVKLNDFKLAHFVFNDRLVQR